MPEIGSLSPSDEGFGSYAHGVVLTEQGYLLTQIELTAQLRNTFLPLAHNYNGSWGE
jgi:hypothetical protein